MKTGISSGDVSGISELKLALEIIISADEKITKKKKKPLNKKDNPHHKTFLDSHFKRNFSTRFHH
ncbi:MAG: hypothetical protein KFW09_04260 [Oscillospiraceae bacterium]|nr:hypothetical protein [Oscillospiraceae bacterium]